MAEEEPKKIDTPAVKPVRRTKKVLTDAAAAAPGPEAPPKPAPKPAAKPSTKAPSPKGTPKATAKKPAPKAAPKPRPAKAPEPKPAPEPVVAETKEPVKAPEKKAAKKPEKAPAREKKPAKEKPAKKGKKPAKKVEKEEEAEEPEEEEKEHEARKKPELTEAIRAALRIRREIARRRPTFYRQEWFRYPRLGLTWRKPQGGQSKLRRHYGYRINVVSIGFRGPKTTRGLHPSGFQEVLVHTPAELKRVDPKTQAVRIAGGVGGRKRVTIQEEADELGIRILNRREE